MKTFVGIILIIIISISSINSSQLLSGDLSKNDDCKYGENLIGVCKKISDCLDEFKSHKNDLKICQFGVKIDDAIICCPQTAIAQRFEYEKNFFDINKCRERHLNLRKRSGNAIQSRIIAGTEVEEFKWTSMAAIGWTQNDTSIEYYCGGVIISKKYILTAYHCRGKKRYPDTVRVGDRFLKTTQDDQHAQQLGIEEFFPHPDYNEKEAYNDIAVVKTDREIVFNNHVAPACIGDITDDSIKLNIAGYGQAGLLEDSSHILHETSVNIYPNSNCSDQYDDYERTPNGIVNSQICTLGEIDSDGSFGDACNGDGGGPLQYVLNYKAKDKETYEIPVTVAIVSFGIHCGLNIPSVNTRISYYRDWILAAMNGRNYTVEVSSTTTRPMPSQPPLFKESSDKFGFETNQAKQYDDDFLSTKACLNRQSIGQFKIVDRILYGTLANEFGWLNIAALGWTQNDKSIKYLCGGTIITERFILTAAHCRDGRKFPDTVRVGDRFLQTTQDDEHAQQLNIERFVYHPDFGRYVNYNDIAVIKTASKIVFNNHVAPACINEINNESIKLKIAGYGKVELIDAQPSNILHEISVNIFPNSKCTKTFEYYVNVPNGILSSQICVKSEEISPGKYPDSCHGDSGGPLQYKFNHEVRDENNTMVTRVYEVPMVVGIVSFGVECGYNVPSVNIRLSSYRKWILAVMNNL